MQNYETEKLKNPNKNHTLEKVELRNWHGNEWIKGEPGIEGGEDNSGVRIRPGH